MRDRQEAARVTTGRVVEEVKALGYAVSPDGVQEAAVTKIRHVLSPGPGSLSSVSRWKGTLRAALDRFMPAPTGPSTADQSPEGQE